MFVARLWGLHYNENGEEVHEKCWLTKDGGCTTLENFAAKYLSEADAWLHLESTGNIGYSENIGAWSWVEEKK